MNLDLPIILHILSFTHSFNFYNISKRIVKSKSLLNNYFDFNIQEEVSLSLLRDYVLLDYFLYHKHLLILDKWQDFSNFYKVNGNLNKYHFNSDKNTTYTRTENTKNIMRISYFVSSLRRIELHQRQKTNDKIEQSNTGIAFKIFIDSIHKESEIELELLRCRSIVPINVL